MFKKKYWLVFSGDKRNGDAKLVLCTCSKRKLKQFVMSKIKDGAFEYRGCAAGNSAPCVSYGKQ